MSQPPQEQPRLEAEIATPPRGMPQPAPVWGAGPPAPPTPQRRRASTVHVLQVIALVVGLVGTGWISSEHFRTVWLGSERDEPVAVDGAGAATHEGLTVSLVEATDLGATPSLPGTDWQPPSGFHAWRVVLDAESTNPDLFACDVALVDGGGRHFVANLFVDSFVDGFEWTFSCGLPEPDDDIPPQQALLVLVPADAEPTAVEITSTAFSSGYIELEID